MKKGKDAEKTCIEIKFPVTGGRSFLSAVTQRWRVWQHKSHVA